MPRAVVLLIYNLLLPIVLTLGFPSFIIKGIRRGGLARNFRQRFGFYTAETKKLLTRPGNFWVHAVSVGEINVAEKIILALLDREPDRNVVLSTTTTTGFRVADEKFANCENVTVIHNPVDLSLIAWRAISLIQPEKMILVEAEVWPNLVRQLQKRSVPIFLVNARLSPRSAGRYEKFSAFVEPIFQMLDAVCVQFEADQDRWAKIGVAPEKIHLTGSVKFDEEKAAERPDDKIEELETWLSENGVRPDQKILLGGSTHAGEELLISKIWWEINDPDLALVIVPRHAERAAEIQTELASESIGSVLRINRVGSENELCSFEKPPVLVANTTGELRAWFYLAEAVIIGKSFTGKGGQNPAESVMVGKPTIVGPNMQNFAGVMQDLVAADGILQLPENDPNSLKTAILETLADSNKAAEMANRGRAAMESHGGAAARTVDVILRGG